MLHTVVAVHISGALKPLVASSAGRYSSSGYYWSAVARRMAAYSIAWGIDHPMSTARHDTPDSMMASSNPDSRLGKQEDSLAASKD
jgi:hypothetical protein